MDAALLIARLLVAAVFILAGVAKLADRQGSRQAIIDFGVPSALAAPLGLLPLAELAVAATLLPASTAWWGLWGRWYSSRCSSWASPSTWLAGERQSATASASFTPLRLAGGRSHATESSLPWRASSCGRAMKVEPDSALSLGSELSRRPSCWPS